MATQEPASLHLLFAYGTLMRMTGFPPVDKAMKDYCQNLGRAWIAGHLFDLGGYPGAVSAAPKHDVISLAIMDVPKIWGCLYQVQDPLTLFFIIDEYESFDSIRPLSSEFIRGETIATMAQSGEALLTQAYFYNISNQALVTIPSGDYWEHLQAIPRNP